MFTTEWVKAGGAYRSLSDRKSIGRMRGSLFSSVTTGPDRDPPARVQRRPPLLLYNATSPINLRIPISPLLSLSRIPAACPIRTDFRDTLRADRLLIVSAQPRQLGKPAVLSRPFKALRSRISGIQYGERIQRLLRNGSRRSQPEFFNIESHSTPLSPPQIPQIATPTDQRSQGGKSF